MAYEYHNYTDNDLPVIFHLDTMRKATPDFNTHWHENIELLFFIEGEARVQSDETTTLVKAGEISVINSNRLHSVHSESKQCRYYCLIIDKLLCDSLGIVSRSHNFPYKTSDREAIISYRKIISEFESRQPYYHQTIKAYCGVILSRLARICSESECTPLLPENKKLQLVKDVIQYMYEHFNETITVEDICRTVGFSKYYLCHTFKEITGHTALQHLNFIRCNNARALLVSGSHNVLQSALSSGFRDPSYFTKTYKRLIGNLPSQDSIK